MATQPSGAVLFYSHYTHPPTQTPATEKIKHLHIFVKALPFSPFTVCVALRSESSWLGPSESPPPLSSVPTATRWRQLTGRRWQWSSQTDGHTGSPSSGQFSPSPESPPPAVHVGAERRRRQRWRRQKAELFAQTKCQTVNSRLPICFPGKTLTEVNKKGDKYCERKLDGFEHANKQSGVNGARYKLPETWHTHEPGYQPCTKAFPRNNPTSRNLHDFLHQIHSYSLHKVK